MFSPLIDIPIGTKAFVLLANHGVDAWRKWVEDPEVNVAIRTGVSLDGPADVQGDTQFVLPDGRIIILDPDTSAGIWAALGAACRGTNYSHCMEASIIQQRKDRLTEEVGPSTCHVVWGWSIAVPGVPRQYRASRFRPARSLSGFAGCQTLNVI